MAFSFVSREEAMEAAPESGVFSSVLMMDAED